MLRILEQSPGNIIVTGDKGEINKTYDEKFLPILNIKVARQNKISWYFEMEQF